jgi:hypothetical protein
MERRDLPVHRVTSCPNHHFFGYYDKCPWDANERYLLALEVGFIDRMPTPDDVAVIGMVDLATGAWRTLDRTGVWNWQQGTMLQWLGSAPDRQIIYNSLADGRYVSVIRDVQTGEARTLPRPIYAVSPDGRQAVTLNFSRVHRRRPGYGYEELPDLWATEDHPKEDGIYWMNLRTGENRLIISIDQVVGTKHDATMDGVQSWFNHLQFNTDGSRFLFLHRWARPTGGWFTRLFTANPDGSELHCVADHQMISHFDWRDTDHILAWARQNGIGDYFFLFQDRTGKVDIVGKGVMPVDGHCSYSPDRKWILNDTYPDKESKRALYLYRPSDGRRVDIGRFYSPPAVTGPFRCDLHPRWSRDGRKVCFDSVHEGDRQMYRIDVGEVVDG